MNPIRLIRNCLILGFFLILLTVGVGCENTDQYPTEDQVFVSPRKDRKLVVKINNEENSKDHGCVAFEIQDANGVVLHAEQTRAPDRYRWEMGWDGNDAVYLKSSDISDYYWELQPDGQWKKRDAYDRPSPDGSFILGNHIGKNNCAVISIQKKDEFLSDKEDVYTVIYSEQTEILVEETGFRDLNWLKDWRWISNDAVEFKNNDLGPYYWVRNKQGHWTRTETKPTLSNFKS